jgi:type VI secretion system protein ImpC
VSAIEQQAQTGAAPTTTVTERSLLDQMLDATRMTERPVAQDMLRTLVEEALKGTVTWDKNVTKTIKNGMQAIDEAISRQLAAIMHHPDFQKLEGSWRGLHYLVMNSETSTMLKIKVLNLSKRELFRDLDRAVEFDQSQLFKKVYEGEFGMPGGAPYGALIGDYEFTNHPEDIELLSKASSVAAAAFAPFISAAAPGLFGFDNWTELAKPRDLEKIFDTIEYTKWRSYRDSEDSRFVTLAMPRVLSRLPYGAATKPIEEFNFEEVELDTRGKAKPVPHEHYAWMNAAYVLGTRLTDAFSKYQWCTAIRGAEGGGKVENLPAHIFISDDGDPDLKCPTEIGITDRREAELGKCGFLPLCHYKNTDYAVFFGAQTSQKPKKYQGPEGADATANAAISARLPYIMATSRIAHYLKVMARDWIGSFMEPENCESRLNTWIKNYVNTNPTADPEMKAKYPLREAVIKVQAIPEKPGSYNAIAFLRPWLQLEELTTSLRLVARIPKMGT